MIASPARRLVVFAIVALALPLAALSSVALAKEEQQPTFRSSVRLVNVTVVAHDSSGQPVRDLAAADFRVFEDGKEQKIEVFAVETDRLVPPRAAPASSAAPNVFSNRQAQRAAGGVTVILFDRLNSTQEDQKSARDQILKLLANIRSSDRVALYILESDTVTVLHDFTSEASRLVAVLNRYFGTTSVELSRSEEKAPEFARSGVAAEDAATEAWLQRTTEQVQEMFLRRRAELSTNALESIANHLAGIPGRKNLVWVSGGFPLVIPSADGPQIMERQVSRAARAISSADVAVYPVDIRGLIGAFVNPATASAPFTRGAAPPQVFTTMATTHPNQDSMRAIAEATGGRVYVNTNAIGDAVRRAIDDSRVSYVLGYHSSRPDGDDKFRNISVKVGRSGVELRYRKGYLAAPPVARDAKARLAALARVLRSPIEASSLELKAEVARTMNDGTVVVRIDPDALTWMATKKDLREAAIDVVIVQSVPDGTYFKIKETTVSLTADPERYQQMVEDGLSLSSNFTLVPNAYRLHVIVSDVASQSVGSLIIPIKN